MNRTGKVILFYQDVFKFVKLCHDGTMTRERLKALPTSFSLSPACQPWQMQQPNGTVVYICVCGRNACNALACTVFPFPSTEAFHMRP